MSLYDKILAEAATEQQATGSSRSALALDHEPVAIVREYAPGDDEDPFDNGEDYAAGSEGLVQAFEDSENLGYVYSVVTGEPVEPDHPDSPLRRAGLI